LFTSVGSSWEFDEKAGVLAIDLPDELPANNAPVDVTAGSTAPGFLVTAADGKEIRLADFRGKKNVVLEFFRSGSW
jgi:cytochrome oxidase Cu insertion factor (SCO1/SenC/PrrC family)